LGGVCFALFFSRFPLFCIILLHCLVENGVLLQTEIRQKADFLAV